MKPERKSKYFYFEYDTSRAEFELPYASGFKLVGKKKEFILKEPNPEAPPTTFTTKERDYLSLIKHDFVGRYDYRCARGAIGRFHSFHHVDAAKVCWVLNGKDKRPQVTGFLQLKKAISMSKFNSDKHHGNQIKLEITEDFPTVLGDNHNIQDFSKK